MNTCWSKTVWEYKNIYNFISILILTTLTRDFNVKIVDVSQTAEQNDLRLPELVTNWISDDTARENRQNIQHYCRNKLSNSAVPDTKNH